MTHNGQRRKEPKWPSDGVLLSQEKRRSPDTRYHVDNLENTMLSEKPDTEGTQGATPLTGSVQKRQSHRQRVGSWLSGAGETDGGEMTNECTVSFGLVKMFQN